MKKILILTLIILPVVIYGQNKPILPSGLPSPKTNGYEEKGWYRADSGLLSGFRDTSFRPIPNVGAKVTWNNQYWKWNLSLLKWELESIVTDTSSLSNRINQKLNKVDSNILQGYVTPTYGDDRYVVRVSQNPTATITPSYTLQKRVTDTTLTVNYTYGRLAATSSARATENIASVLVDGVSRGFTNPAAGSSNAGSASITYTPSATKNVSIVVTAADGKTNPAASINITANSFTYYRGFVNTATPNDAQLWGLGQNVFPSTIKGTNGQTLTLPAPGSAQWYVFAYPSSLGTASFVINGFGATLTLIQRNVTNTNGFTEQFNIYVAQAPTAGLITYLIN